MPLSAYAAITVEELRRYLPVTGGQKDDLLEDCINAATDDWEAEWGRHIVTRGTALAPSEEFHTVMYGGANLYVDELRPRQWPVIAIVSVHESTGWPRTYDADTLLVEGTDYEIVRGQRDFLRRIGSGGSGFWAPGTRTVKIVGRFGYSTVADVPARIKERVKELARLKFGEITRSSPGMSSQSDAMGNFTRFAAASITEAMRAASQAEYRLERYETGEAAA